MKSSELLALLNLDGWRIDEGYYIVLKHTCWGTFPALISKTGKDFVCLNKEVVKKAISLLTDRPYTADKHLILINENEKIAFLLGEVQENWKNNFIQRDFKPEHRINYDAESILVLTEEDLENMKTGTLNGRRAWSDRA